MISFFLDILFPPTCAGCRIHKGSPVCRQCERAITTARMLENRCPVCDHRLVETACEFCAIQPLALQQIFSLGAYEAELYNIIMAFKFHGQKRLAAYLGRLMADILCSECRTHPDCILFPPMQKDRLRERGYNTAELLAHTIGGAAHIPVWDIFGRSRIAPPQRTLGRAERITNVRQLFILRKDILSLQEKHVVIADDVTTTGSTLNALAQECLNAGAASVTGITAAYPAAKPIHILYSQRS